MWRKLPLSCLGSWHWLDRQNTNVSQITALIKAWSRCIIWLHCWTSRDLLIQTNESKTIIFKGSVTGGFQPEIGWGTRHQTELLCWISLHHSHKFCLFSQNLIQLIHLCHKLHLFSKKNILKTHQWATSCTGWHVHFHYHKHSHFFLFFFFCILIRPAAFFKWN